MKVVIINGSPHKKGCTYTALAEVAGQLEAEGIETVWVHVGAKPVQDCIACGKCAPSGRCVFDDDQINATADLLREADGLLVGSPVYYAGPSGAVCSFLDRLFYPCSGDYEGKVAAAVVSCRRAGSTAALDRLNKYFNLGRMPQVNSQYWNMVHGNTPDEVRQDLEGLQIMRTLGRNMAWMLKSIEAGGIPRPEREATARTNFIR